MPAGMLRMRARGRARWCAASVLLLLLAPARTPAAPMAPAALPSCRTKQKKKIKKGARPMPGCCCHPVFISIAQEWLCWVQRPKGCRPSGQDALWGCPQLPQVALSPVISSQCHAGGTCSPLRGLRHGCHGRRIRLPKEEAGPPLAGVRFRKPWGNSTVSAPQAAPPPPRSHPGEAGFCLPGDLHSSMLPPKRFPSVGCSCWDF